MLSPCIAKWERVHLNRSTAAAAVGFLFSAEVSLVGISKLWWSCGAQ